MPYCEYVKDVRKNNDRKKFFFSKFKENDKGILYYIFFVANGTVNLLNCGLHAKAVMTASMVVKNSLKKCCILFEKKCT